MPIVSVGGAAGGVGRFAVQLAARSGARVTGVVGGPGRGEGLEELGAEELVWSTGDAQGKFDLILESAEGESLAAAFGLVAPRGTIVAFGNSSNEPTPFDFFGFFGHEVARLQTFHSYASSGEEGVGEDLSLLASLAASGDLVPQVGAEANWRELAAVADDLRERRVNGKAVLRVD